MLDRKEWEAVERLVNKELRRLERRPSNPPPGGRDAQAFKIERLRILAQKVHKELEHATI